MQKNRPQTICCGRFVFKYIVVSVGFLTRPVISYSMVDEDANKPHIVVTTAASNQAISFQVFKSDDGSAGSTTSGMSVMMTAIGV